MSQTNSLRNTQNGSGKNSTARLAYLLTGRVIIVILIDLMIMFLMSKWVKDCAIPENESRMNSSNLYTVENGEMEQKGNNSMEEEISIEVDMRSREKERRTTIPY